MVTLLRKWIIKTENPTEKRRLLGSLCGILGIVLNLLLFIGKIFAGWLCGSIAIVADAFNNLSDAGSSVINLIGFQFSGKKPDPDHPFGHGRIEYISGFLVSMLIFLMGFELAKTSIEKIIDPSVVNIQMSVLIILLFSVVIKLYMAFYNYKISKEISASAMKATAIDSFSDAISTTAVLISTFIIHITGWKIDGWIGLVVSGMILYAGYNAAKETISPLLGQPPERDFVNQIYTIVMSNPDIIGIHDLVVHDYGPGRVMISLHAEVAACADFVLMHDLIDNIEMDLAQQLGCEATIHMDPVDTKNEDAKKLKKEIEGLAHSLDENITIHDFRMVTGVTHTNLIFDVVSPHSYQKSDEELIHTLSEMVSKLHPTFQCVIKVDKPYV